MIHQYKMGGRNIVMDIASGSIHEVDDATYDMIELYGKEDRESVVKTIADRYPDLEEGEAAAVRIKRMESCNLMILDDLGTEMPTPMGQSALYTLINNRLVNGKKTIISTNLSNEELGKRYTPQIASRIMGEFQRLPFVGEDIRRLKRGV